MDPLNTVIRVSASGLRAQSERLRIISENVANSNSTAQTPGGDPYKRKVITFGSSTDASTGAAMVSVSGISRDNSGFQLRYDPAHPAADEAGFVKLPNVSPIIEMSNMREAARSYEANMNMLESARKMRSELIDLLK